MIQSDMLNVYPSPTHLFLSFCLSLPTLHPLKRLSQLWQRLFPMHFPLPDGVIPINAMPHHWWVPISCCGTWSSSMYKVYIPLLELQAVAFILCKVAFQFPIKVVALHLDSSIAKAYLCNQGGTASLFFRLACCFLTLAKKHGITLNIAYISSHINVEAISWGQFIPEWHMFPHIVQANFHLWGQLEEDLIVYSCTNQCQYYLSEVLCFLLQL